MAEVTLAPQRLVQGGLAPVRQAVLTADVYLAANDGRVALHVRNNGVGAVNVTVVTQAQVAGNAIADRVVAIPAGQERMIGDLPPAVFNDPNNLLRVQFDTQDTIDLLVFRLP